MFKNENETLCVDAKLEKFDQNKIIQINKVELEFINFELASVVFNGALKLYHLH